MLSYKFKHFCASVLASLSTFGIASISEGGAAETNRYARGSTYSWGNAGTLSFAANYGVSCTEVENATFVRTSDDKCLYTCNDGYLAHAAGQTGAVMNYKSDYGKYAVSFEVAAGSAVSAIPSCRLAEQPSNLICEKGHLEEISGHGFNVDPHVALRVMTDTDGSKYAVYGCEYECRKGYSVREGQTGITGTHLTADDTLKGFTLSDGTGNYTNYCYPIYFQVKYDCGEDGFVSGTEERTLVVKKLYEQEFDISYSCEPESGKNIHFIDWTLTVE